MPTKILLIEDEPSLQKALGLALEKEGFAVTQATDGQLGLDLAKKDQPDLILLDLILPKKDGFAVLAELKADEKLKQVPVIILTNLETSQDVQKALTMGATTYLVKANYELADVIKKIKSVIQG